MSSKVIKTELGITRSSNGFYYIRIGCETSHTTFCELKLTGEQFAEAVTGLFSSDIEAEVKGLDRVGKTRIRELRSIICPLDSYKTDDLEEWLVQNAQEDGWFLDSYLRSQSSKKRVDNGYQLNYSVYKYIEG
jgi:hypothetical protein